MQVLVHLHDRGLVAAAVAVVWRRKNSYNIVVMVPLEPSHNELMGSSDNVKTIPAVELLGHVHAERVSSSARADSPPWPLVWVAPHEIAHGTLVRHLLAPL